MDSTGPRVAAEPATLHHAVGMESRFPELIANPIEKCRCAPAGSRLNLVIPGISKKRISSGGPATALRLFQRLALEFPNARIVVTHEVRSECNFNDWPQWTLDDGYGVPRSIVFLGDRSTPLTLSAEDFFLATFWSTAFYVKSVVALQAQLFSSAIRRFAYLIQDYEPGFYPWSARHAYAKSTYRDLDGVIAVFNTSLLADYFELNGLRFKEQHVFEPTLHPQLRKRKNEPNRQQKERLILVYARPSIPRNDFDFIVEVLRIWAKQFPRAGDWSVVSAGEPHADVPLWKDITLHSGGQMSIDEYASHLSQCWVGLSFMFSAHPSYPPLEMAEFGAWVVTNRFANKDLSLLAPSIIAVDEARADEAAEKLAWCCKEYRATKTAAIADLSPVFSPEGEEFPFACRLVESWVSAGRTERSAVGP
jgi:O-antigen biosynthesis protein